MMCKAEMCAMKAETPDFEMPSSFSLGWAVFWTFGPGFEWWWVRMVLLPNDRVVMIVFARSPDTAER